MAINKRKRETAVRLILVAGSIGLGLVALEVIGRTEGLMALIAPRQGDIFAASNLQDPELRHIHPPHLHLSGSLKGGDINGAYRIPRAEMTSVKYDLQYDENGFRNKADLKKADIVVIGDSFVEGVSTPDAELINARLGQIRGETVANLGQYDYGPIEELAVLRRYGLPLRPHTVVWMFFEGNDLSDVARRYPAPAPSASRITAPPAPQPRRFFLRELASRLRQTWREPPKEPGIKRAGILKTSNGGDRTVWFRYPAQPLSAKDISALDETARILATAEKLCSDNGAHLLFVFIPIKYRALHESCRFPEGSECAKWVLNDMPERLRKAVGPTSSGVGFIDLTPAYAEAARKGVLAYFPDDDHWSSDGQNLAAEVVNDYISSNWGK